MPGSAHVPGVKPKHGLTPRAGPAQAHPMPCRAVLGPGQKGGLRAGPSGLGLHGHIYVTRFELYVFLSKHEGHREEGLRHIQENDG